jgi:gamma-glutamyltranspeptidase/glutathione hydrolase
MVDFGSANSLETNIGGEHPVIDSSDNGDHDSLAQSLRKLGDHVNLAVECSGLTAIARDGAGWVGGADPRREGLVAGDTR